MVIGVCYIYLNLPVVHSLKDKRQILQSLMRRVRNEFNVAIAEVDYQDDWQRAELGAACVSTDAGYAHGLLTKMVNRIQGMRMDAMLVDFEIEML